MAGPLTPLLWIGGTAVLGWAFGKADGATDSAKELTKWAVIGGGVYVSYRALQATGAIK